MSSTGRPPLGPQLVETLDVSAAARKRLQLILETIAGLCSVKDASAKLGISEARFHVMRRETLEVAGQSLEPKPSGRRPAPRAEGQERVEELECELREMKVQLEGLRIREEIALIAPHLLIRKNACLKPRSARVRSLVRPAGKSDTSRS